MGEGHVVERGAIVAAGGIFGIPIGQVGWFANLFWAAGVVFLSRRRWNAAAAAATLAVLVAANSFLLPRTGMPSDSGYTHPVTLMSGFYVWWASHWVLTAGALLLWRRPPAEPARVEEVPA